MNLQLIFGKLVSWYIKLLLSTEILVIILVEYHCFSIFRNLNPLAFNLCKKTNPIVHKSC